LIALARVVSLAAGWGRVRSAEPDETSRAERRRAEGAEHAAARARRREPFRECVELVSVHLPLL